MPPTGSFPERVRRHLEEILASKAFRNSPRMCAFLRFLVETKLDRPGIVPKETVVAMEVFGRGSGFDPRLDTVVRVQAVRLRSKLVEFYATDGAAASLRIELPPGSYVPFFAEATLVPSSPPHERVTLAVLPFADMSQDRDQAYFCDGIAEEILHLVAQSNYVLVAGRTSSFLFRDSPHDVRAIGETLGVQHVLEGSIRKSGGSIRVTAQLIDARTGFHIWSETFDRQLTNLFALQDELASAITARLLGEPAPQRRRTEPSLAAHDLCLLARHEFNQQTVPGLLRARELYQNAVELEASFEPAWTGLATAYVFQAFYGLGVPRDLLSEARKASLRALELDAASEDAYLTLGAVSAIADLDLPLSLELYRRALRMNPSSVTAHVWLSYACECLGDFDTALHHMRQAQLLDPLSPLTQESMAFCLFLRREHQESLRVYQQLFQRVPRYPLSWLGIAWNHLALDDYPAALDAARNARSQWGDHPMALGTFGMAAARVGLQDEARACLASMEEMGRHAYVNAFDLALVHIGLGEAAEALRNFEVAFQQRGGFAVFASVHPLLDPVRNAPAFQSLLEQLGLTIR